MGKDAAVDQDSGGFPKPQDRMPFLTDSEVVQKIIECVIRLEKLRQWKRDSMMQLECNAWLWTTENEQLKVYREIAKLEKHCDPEMLEEMYPITLSDWFMLIMELD